MSPFLRKQIYAVICAGLAVGTSLSAQQINNNFQWSLAGAAGGTTEETRPFIAPFGSEQTYGQTFKAPNGYDQIFSFTFQLRSLNQGDLLFAAYLGLWDNDTGRLAVTAVGSDVAPTFLVKIADDDLPSSSSNSFLSFTFSFQPINLDSTKTYVAFLTTIAPDVQPSLGTAAMGSPNYAFSNGTGEAFTGGRFVYFGTDKFENLYKSKWEGIEASDQRRDAAFVATFSQSTALVTVPEPSTYGVFAALALGGVIAVRRFRSKKSV